MKKLIKTDQELPLDQEVSFSDNVDIIFTAGYPQDTKCKIEGYLQVVGHASLIFGRTFYYFI